LADADLKPRTIEESLRHQQSSWRIISAYAGGGDRRSTESSWEIHGHRN
jgi:hypothetical protein